MRKIYIIGESLLDIIFKHHQPVYATPGGSMLNASVTLGRLKQPVYFITEIGKDRTGIFINEFLRQNHVNTGCVHQYADGKTPLALAYLDDNENADYSFYKLYPKQRLTGVFPEVRENDIILFGSFHAVNQETQGQVRKFVQSAQNAGAIVLYDPNIRKSASDKQQRLAVEIANNLELADITRGSDEDFRNIYQTDDMDEVFRIIQSRCSLLICTRGSDGVHLRTPTIQSHFEVPPILPVSTIGAGDTFNAGIIHGLMLKNINKQDLPALTKEAWKEIITGAASFAKEVCLSYENYISLR